MWNVSFIVRLVLGIIFAFLGYYVADKFIPHTLPYVPFSLAQAMIAFLSGAFGVFLLPVLSQIIGQWSRNLMQSLAKEVVEQTIRLRAARTKTEDREEKIKPKNDESKPFRENPMLLDTSAIIDGRIADIITTGFVSGCLMVPQFILAELQRIADSSDALRRGRGRRGLEILDQLKNSPFVKFEVIDQDAPKAKNVDEKLVRLAKQFKAKIITTDFNLNRVANVSGIKTLNVNELANSVKTVTLPGEELSVKVIQEGKEEGQGVGYLPDGTMIVVEQGSRLIGKTVEVMVARVLQTVAGRMIFVQIKSASENSSHVATKSK